VVLCTLKGLESLPPLTKVLQRQLDKQNRGSASLLSVKLNFDYEIQEEEKDEYIKKYKTVEKPAKTQTSIQLASHLVKAPTSRSGGHEFESPIWRELGALTQSGKTLGVRSFYSGDPDVITLSCQFV
jgi:hypothetical protein